jgi:hypothetical protein
VHGDYLEEEPFCGYVPLKMQKAGSSGKGEKKK